jgi:uncharacterized membrane protein
MSRTKKITYTAMIIALAVTLRILKAYLFGPVQFVNFPGVFTIVAGVLFGPVVGMTVGFSSFTLSDIMIGLPGPWTVINSVIMSGLGFASGLIWGRNGYGKITKTGLAVGSFLLMFVYDILSSTLFYFLTSQNVVTTFFLGLQGLFLPSPSSGGWMILPGPTTEFTTTLLIVTIIGVLVKSKISVGRGILGGEKHLNDKQK